MRALRLIPVLVVACASGQSESGCPVGIFVGMPSNCTLACMATPSASYCSGGSCQEYPFRIFSATQLTQGGLVYSAAGNELIWQSRSQSYACDARKGVFVVSDSGATAHEVAFTWTPKGLQTGTTGFWSRPSLDLEAAIRSATSNGD